MKKLYEISLLFWWIGARRTAQMAKHTRPQLEHFQQFVIIRILFDGNHWIAMTVRTQEKDEKKNHNDCPYTQRE